MTTLSLDLRGPGSSGLGAGGRGASLSLLVHGLGIGALVLTPLLTTPEPPETPIRFHDPLVIPIKVTLPPPMAARPKASAKGKATRARAAAPDLSSPRDTPTLILASDLLDPEVSLLHDSAGPGGNPGGTGEDVGVDCALGALCGGSPLPTAAKARETPRVGGLIKEPKLIQSHPPQYPPMAQAAGVSGQVILEAHVSEHGRILDVRILQGHDLFNEAALASVRSRVYEPLLLNGVRSDFVVTITMRFTARR